MNPLCVHVCVLSRVRPIGIPWTVAHQALLSMEFSRQESWSGLPCHLLLQVICLIQAGIKPMPLGLLHWQVDSLPLTNPSATSIYCLCFQCILNVLSYLLQEWCKYQTLSSLTWALNRCHFYACLTQQPEWFFRNRNQVMSCLCPKSNDFQHHLQPFCGLEGSEPSVPWIPFWPHFQPPSYLHLAGPAASLSILKPKYILAAGLRRLVSQTYLWLAFFMASWLTYDFLGECLAHIG